MSNRLVKLIKNEYVFSIISRVFSVLISLVQSVIVARYLGASLQGVNSYITSITNIGAIVITFGMHQAYPYFRKKYGKEAVFNEYMSLIMLLYLVYISIAAVFMLFKPVSIEVRVAVLLIPVFGYSKIVAYICLIERPNLRNFWWTMVGLLDVVYVFLLMKFTERSFIYAVSILLFAELLKSVVYTIALKPKITISKNMAKLAYELVKYGFFPMMALLMTTLNYKVDVLMLKQYSYISSAMIGVYSLGIQMAERIIMIPDTLKGVLVSRLSKGSDEHEVASVCRLAFWASGVTCLAFLILGKFVIQILYGSEYEGAYMPLMICSFGTIAISYFKLSAQYNIVNKKQILNVEMLSIAVLTDVILNLLFIPIWGINGAALATGIGNLVCGVTFLIWFCNKFNISYGEMTLPQKSDIAFLKKLLGKQ